MKKKLKNMKGFAMAELLAVSLVILVLFSVLFSNYLPLVAEYENRIMYNDVSAQYAAYYVRQIVKGAIENDRFSEKIVQINNNIYVFLFKNGDNASNEICALVDANAHAACNRMIALYDIKEVIVTNYSLTKIKNKDSGYKQSDGSLYEYIQYLPEYENTIYNGDKELYRIILKADNKYATTPVKVDYTTPGKCFTGTRGTDGILTITGYNENDSDCGKEVVISTKQISIKNSNGKTITGIIKKIGNEAFKNKEINSIDFGNVTEIGTNAFKYTNLEEVNLPDNLVSIGNSAFSNIKTLKSISLADEDIYGNTSNLFSDSGGSINKINVELKNNIKTVGERMFYNTNIGSIDFGNVETIKKEAFAMNGTNSVSPFSIKIPNAVKTIGEGAFKDRNINGLTFETGLDIISKEAFAMSSKSATLLSSVTIPNSLTILGESAFENREIKLLVILDQTSLTFIPKNAFYNCGIEQLNNFNTRIITIGESAFDKNTFSNNTKPVNIPATVTSIGRNAFPMITGSQYNVSKNTLDVVKNWCEVFQINNCVKETADGNNTYVIRDENSENVIYMYVS